MWGAYIIEENEAPFLEFSRRLPATYEAPDRLKPDSGGIFDMRCETLRRRRGGGIPLSGE